MSRPTLQYSPDRAGRLAFTLVEVLMSMLVISSLVVATASVISLAGRAVSSKGAIGASSTDSAATGIATNAQVNSVQAGMDLFTAELKTAISITSQTATSITFVVPDRNGDGQNETINYAWLSAGTALKRTYNGGVGIEVIEALQGFTVTPVSRTNSPLAPVESAEFQLLNNEAVTLSVVSPTTTDYFAQYFNPQRNLPWNTLTWKLTRMQLYCTWPTTSGTFTYEIYAADAAKKPTGAVLASTTFAMSNSLLGQWVNINVADLPGLVPGSGLVLVVKSTATTLLDDAHVPVKTGMTPSAAMASYESTDSGSTWGTRDQTKNAIFRVYGTVITQP